MSQTSSISFADAPRRLTGAAVLMTLVAFFGVIAAVDVTMMFLAVSTFRGEDTAHAYEKGLAYNLDIAGARAQEARGWKVEASLMRLSETQNRIEVALRDAQGPIRGLKLAASIRSPVDAKQDIGVALVETAPGRYAAPLAIEPGWRDLVLTAARDGREAFRSKNRIRLD
ncbi:FixH family protein [Methylosinus sp. Sm6]|uniref:FixH family protein n=1 Tax=Methylosinus sp. Sm6 TaxID=2866948 RepID=UPI001C9A2651|nr:FixH family protein [Methylosinus sp. Sm6]MBY6242503.1 FixH family protein [Methylosinus sp. Sm6]